MSYHNEFGIVALIILMVFSSIVCAELNGTINLSYMQNSSPLVTGLRGETLATTTTVSNSSSSSNTDSGIQTGNTTTTTVRTTTTIITTTTSLLPYDHYSAGQIFNNFSASSLNNSIENISNLSAAIAKYIGNSSAIDITTSNQLVSELSIIKSLDIYQNRSRLDVRLFFNGTTERKNVLIYDIVPKSFAESADNITVESAYGYTVVENDPSFLFLIPSIKQNEMISINYVVSKKVDSSAINYTSIEIFAGPQSSAMDLWIIGIIIIGIASAVVIFVLVRNGTLSLDNLKIPASYKTEYIKSEKKPNKIQELIEKIKKLFEKKASSSPVVFRYEYKK